ncbi:MAG: hypothetical protein R2780_12585 [Crocinitomicaceae bacterium]|nr:hypothetical protein [Crocinitomicaceae bacterium]
MRLLLLGIFFIISFNGLAQTKDQLILDGPKDSVLVYAGEGFLAKGNCLLIKFTGDGQLFFNELASFHAQDENQIQRTELELNVYHITKPYWVYGTYSVHAKLETRGTYTLIEIYFQAYNNPGNYKMHGADKAYQEIINKLLKK